MFTSQQGVGTCVLTLQCHYGSHFSNSRAAAQCGMSSIAPLLPPRAQHSSPCDGRHWGKVKSALKLRIKIGRKKKAFSDESASCLSEVVFCVTVLGCCKRAGAQLAAARKYHCCWCPEKKSLGIGDIDHIVLAGSQRVYHTST